jgi:AraC-like DNA-binding protein
MFVLEAVIVIQGIILVTVLLQKRNLNAVLLGWVILCFSANLLFELITGWGLFMKPIPFGYFFALCYGPLFYYYIQTYFEERQLKRNKLLLHFAPALVSLLIILFDYRILFVQETLISIIVMGHIIAYSVLSIKSFDKGNSKIENKLTELKRRHIHWTKRELHLFVIICSMMIIVVTLKLSGFNLYAIDGAIVITYLLIMYLMIAIMIKLLSYPKTHQIAGNNEKYNLNAIMDYIIQKGLHKKESLKIKDVAENVNISSSKLSEMINSSYGAPFNSFINKIRVDEAKMKLKNSQDQIKYVMYDVGFNSRSVFNETFKKFTGMTPQEYRKSCKDF